MIRRNRIGSLILLALMTATGIGAQSGIEEDEPPPTSQYGWVPIAKIDGPLTFGLTAAGRRISLTLALAPDQRANLDITTTRTDSSCCFSFEPTYDRVRPPRLGFEIEGDRMLLQFAYAGDTAAYRLKRTVDSLGAAHLAVETEQTARFIRYAPPHSTPDRPRRRKK